MALFDDVVAQVVIAERRRVIGYPENGGSRPRSLTLTHHHQRGSRTGLRTHLTAAMVVMMVVAEPVVDLVHASFAQVSPIDGLGVVVGDPRGLGGLGY